MKSSSFNMTTASEILVNSKNANEACASAELITKDVDQYWDHREATIYTFFDASVLWVSSGQLNAYEDRAQADAANPAS